MKNIQKWYKGKQVNTKLI